MPPLDDPRIPKLRTDVDDLKRRVTELENEKDDVFEAIKRHVERALTAALEPFRGLVDDVRELKQDQKTQLEMMREAAEERGRRKEREDQAEAARKTRVLDIEEKKVVVDVKKVDVDIQRIEVDSRVRKATLRNGIIIAIITGLLALAGVALSSHH